MNIIWETVKVKAINQTVVFLQIVLFFIFSYCCGVFADEELSKELVNEYKSSLQTLLLDIKSDPKDLELMKEVGKLYFYIGSETKDRKSISKAIKIFKDILEKEPDNAEITAYLGSAFTLKARDFPMKTILSLTPIGYIRLFYVKKGIKKMDSAVEMENLNPIVRLIRGITCYNLPAIFGQMDKSINDFNTLIYWIENPLVNKNYSEILIDKSFKSIVYYHAGKVYLSINDHEKSIASFKKVLLYTDSDSPYGKAAKRMLCKIKKALNYDK